MPSAPTIPAAPTAPGRAEAPAAAFRWSVGPMQFAEVPDGTSVRPFTMLARSGSPIYHWYWGNIVHDMAGMIPRRDSVSVDYEHRSDEVIGFANQFNAGPDGLTVTGSLVSIETNDRADAIYKLGREGVPFESSIDWVGPETELEYIPDGVTTEVNGQQFAGPGYVVRKWPLRAIAVCRYGCDPDTRTQFSAAESAGAVCQFTLSSEGKTVPAPAAPSAPAAAAAAASVEATQQLTASTPVAATPAAQPGMISLDTLRQFTAEFGSEHGPQYLTQGLSLDAARYQFAVHQKEAAETQVKQLSAEKAELTTKLTAMETQLKQLGGQLGQETPIGTGGTENADAVRQFAVLGNARAAFAASMKKRA
jgi:hypothetical protein